MKRILKPIRLFMLLMVMTLLPVSGALAESVPSDAPELAVVKENAVREKSVKLKWSSVSGAEGYRIYQVDPGTGDVMKKYDTAKTNYIVNKLTKGTDYEFFVRAFNDAGLGGKSNSVEITAGFAKPETPTNFKIREYGTRYRILSWAKAKGVTGYILYISDSVLDKNGEEKEPKVKTVTLDKSERSYKAKVADGHSYSYYVVSYKQQSFVPDAPAVEDTDTSPADGTAGSEEGAGSSAPVKIKPVKVLVRSDRSIVLKAKYEKIKIKTVHGWYLHATVDSTVKAVDEYGDKVTLNAGTSVTATAYTSGKVDVILSDGRVVSTSGSNLTYGNLSTTMKKYTVQQAENFVNSRGYKSGTGWLMWVNEYSCITYVFRGTQYNWKCVREMNCVVGMNRYTSQGVKMITRKGTAYGDVATFFGGNSFHRRWATARGAESHGCVRLGTSDLYYVYNTVPVYTTVVFY